MWPFERFHSTFFSLPLVADVRKGEKVNIFDTPKRRPVPSSENDDQETQESRRCIFNRALFCHGSRRERVIGYQLEPDSRFAEMIVAIVIVMCVFVFVCVCVCVCVFLPAA